MSETTSVNDRRPPADHRWLPPASGRWLPGRGRSRLAALIAAITIQIQTQAPARAEPGGEVVARVGPDSVTSSELVRAAARRAPLEGEDADAYRHRLLEPLVFRLLLREEAAHRGLFDDPAVVDRLREDEAVELTTRIRELEIESRLALTDEEVEEALNRQLEEEELSPGADQKAARARVVTKLRQAKRARRRQELDQRLQEELGFALHQQGVDHLAAALIPFDPQLPDDFSGPVAALDGGDLERVLYEWDGGRYTIADFLAGPGAHRSAQTVPWIHAADRLARFLERAFIEGHTAELARRRGLDRTPEFERWQSLHHEELAVEQLYEVAVVESSRATPDELRAHYEANQEAYRAPDLVELDRWTFTERATAEKIERALRQGLPLSVVTKLAKQSNLFEGRQELKQTRPDLERFAGREVAIGDIFSVAGPTRTFVYQVHAIELGDVRPFETVASQVRQEIEGPRTEERLNELLDEIRSRVGVTVDDAALGRVPI